MGSRGIRLTALLIVGLGLVGASAGAAQASSQGYTWVLRHSTKYDDQATCAAASASENNFPDEWTTSCTYEPNGVGAAPPQPADLRPGYYFWKHILID
jgi:hypothetical protein